MLDNELMKNEILLALTLGEGKYVHGMTDEVIHWDIKSRTRQSYSVPDIRASLLPLIAEGKVFQHTEGTKNFYRSTPSTPDEMLLDEDQKRFSVAC